MTHFWSEVTYYNDEIILVFSITNKGNNAIFIIVTINPAEKPEKVKLNGNRSKQRQKAKAYALK